MTPHPARLRDRLEGKLPAMLELLEALVRAESPSDDPDAAGAPLPILAAALEAAGLETRRLPGRGSAGQLLARPARRARRSRYQLLVGHADTVWPRGTLARMPAERRDGRFYGPGAFDMKGGLVALAFALEALRDLAGDGLSVDPVVLVTTDEEIGSQDSVRAIRRLARGADRVLVLEPPLGPEGLLKTARKGTGVFRIRVRGRAAHAGLEPEKGARAIHEAARLVREILALEAERDGLGLNVGTIRGGTRPNVVAEDCELDVDVRVARRADAAFVEERIRGLVPSGDGLEIEVSGGLSRPPMERTPGSRALWETACGIGRDLGLELGEATSGGGSDGNFTSALAPTLDGLGPIGDGAHAPHEHIVVASLPERAALVAGLLLAPALESAPPNPDRVISRS
ncbi:MAG: M20 family metallopeptidase [Gemmatimonadota bacterium]